jgi:hypothetical protein
MAGKWDYGSKEKMDVVITDSPWGKQWVRVELLKSSVFWPSFEDIHRIVSAIGECEDKKYPNGADMLADFLVDCCYCDDFEELRDRYGIPIRPVKVF